MMWIWEEGTIFGGWTTVTGIREPEVRNGRLLRPEGQGPRIRNVRPAVQTEESSE